MKSVYLSDDVPAYLNATAAELLLEGRQIFRDHGLDRQNMLQEDRDLHIFLWRGSQATAVFAAASAMTGLSAEAHDLGMTLSATTAAEAQSLFRKLASLQAPTPVDVSEFVENISTGKYAEYVPNGLARKIWASQNAEIVRQVPEIAKSFV